MLPVGFRLSKPSAGNRASFLSKFSVALSIESVLALARRIPLLRPCLQLPITTLLHRPHLNILPVTALPNRLPLNILPITTLLHRPYLNILPITTLLHRPYLNILPITALLNRSYNRHHSTPKPNLDRQVTSASLINILLSRLSRTPACLINTLLSLLSRTPICLIKTHLSLLSRTPPIQSTTTRHHTRIPHWITTTNTSVSTTRSSRRFAKAEGTTPQGTETFSSIACVRMTLALRILQTSHQEVSLPL